MNSSDELDEKEFEIGCYEQFNCYTPRDITVSGIHRAVLEFDFQRVIRCVESGESVNKKEPRCNYSLLHMAVMYNNVTMLDYLLAREGVEVDARCSKGRTPLYLATALEHYKSAEKLIQAGADVNIPDNNNDAPLHISVMYQDVTDICRLLLRHGAIIRTDASLGGTLQDAVENDYLEIVHMLLYYNVDANNLNGLLCTPFMTALNSGNVEAQELLFEYSYDFNRYSYYPSGYGVTMSFALRTNSPFVEAMIERGGDVNYGDDPIIRDTDCAFLMCLHCYSVDLSTFKYVWERLRFNDSKNTIDFIEFLNYVHDVPAYLQVIIESDNFETALQCFSRGKTYFLFVNKFAEKGYDLDQLTALTCRLLEYGFRPSSYDIHAIFSHYGYCELFRILLYMDNDYSRGWLPHMVLTRLMFDIDYDLESIDVGKVHYIPKETMLQLLEYSVCPRLMDALIRKYGDDESMRAILTNLPRVPSLIELARNPARKQICQAFKVTNTCQFYTVIDHLSIPTVYKDILTFKRKVHTVKV